MPIFALFINLVNIWPQNSNTFANVVIWLIKYSKLFMWMIGEPCCVWRFGPLPDNHVYVVTAEKPGYVLAKEDDNPYNFRAFKLAEVSVHVSVTGVHYNQSEIIECKI